LGGNQHDVFQARAIIKLHGSGFAPSYHRQNDDKKKQFNFHGVTIRWFEGLSS